jgi:hypothetical protein
VHEPVSNQRKAIPVGRLVSFADINGKPCGKADHWFAANTKGPAAVADRSFIEVLLLMAKVAVLILLKVWPKSK